MNIPERNALVAEIYTEQAQGRKAVVFCVDVQHSFNMAAAFRERGIPAEAVYGAMPMCERKNILDAYNNGRPRAAATTRRNVGDVASGPEVSRSDVPFGTIARFE